MDRNAAVRDFVAEPDAADASRRWIECWASHVRKRFNSRALIRARVGGMEPLCLSQLYALEGGGIVLVIPCAHGGHDSKDPPDSHGDRAHSTEAPKPHAHATVGGTHDEHSAHPHGDVDGCCGDREIWLAANAQVVFEAQCVPDGSWCTGFGYLGLSRTPQVLIARGTEPPLEPGHDHGNF